MSSFGGRMKEYERISLDRFDGKNLQSTVYFLSHLHEDHTVGLATPIFFKHLKTSKNVFLYCSEVTEVLIKASKKYRHLLPYIKKIAINTPTTIEIPDPLFDEIETVTVTFLPAFHCPGSVMCLFEGHEGTVLYTGDFRWEHFNIEQMYHLRSGENVKKVKSLYIDTTFCTPENLYIPSRQHCIDATYQLVCEWISQSPQHVVYMSLRAQYGHEPLLNAVASRLNKKIHVDSHKVEVYDQIHEFHGNFTGDGAATQIHACGKQMHNIDGEYIPCRHQHNPDKILVILPTTMYFTQFQHLTLDKIVRKVGDTFFRVCYSFHSSYTEIKDLISYLKPENIYPNVKPPNDASLAVVQHRLNTMLAECMQSVGEGDVGEVEVKQLGMLKTHSSKRVTGKRKQSTPSDTESLDFGTPTKVQKTDIEPKRQTRGRGRKSAPGSSQESATDLTPSRGRGRQTRSSQKAVVEPLKRSSSRSRSKKGAESELSQQKTPVKKQRSESPDVFLTPSKSEVSEKQSSYAGSHGDESEIDLTLSQKSLDLESSIEMRGDNIDTWTGGSFLTAVSSHDEVDACIYVYEDVEQTDENFEDVSQIEEEEEEEVGGLSLEDIEKMETDETSSRVSTKKTPARKGRKSKGKTPRKSNRRVKPTEDCEVKVTAEGLVKAVGSSGVGLDDSKAEIVNKEKEVTETVSETVQINQKSKGVTKSKQKANVEDSKKDENLDKSVEMNIGSIDKSKEEILTEMKATGTPETRRTSRGSAAKRMKKQAKTKEDSELNDIDDNLDKVLEIVTKNADSVDISKEDTVSKEMIKSVERHEKNTEDVVNPENAAERIEISVNETTENRLENGNSKLVSEEVDKVMEEKTKTLNEQRESDNKDNGDLDKSDKQKVQLDKTECSAFDMLKGSNLPFDTSFHSKSSSNQLSDNKGKLEVKGLTETVEGIQSSDQNENSNLHHSPKPGKPDIVSNSAKNTEKTHSEKKTIETLTDKVCKKNDQSLTDADEQKDCKVKEKEQLERNDTKNTDAKLSIGCADVCLVSQSDINNEDSVKKVQNTSNKELEANSSKADKSNSDNSKNDDSSDKGAIAMMENSRDPYVVKLSKSGESQTEISTGACGIEVASQNLKEPANSVVIKENLEEPDAAKVSANEKTDTESEIENTVEKEGQLSADSKATSDNQNDDMKTEGVPCKILSFIEIDDEDEDVDEEISKAILESLGPETDIFKDEDSQVDYEVIDEIDNETDSIQDKRPTVLSKDKEDIETGGNDFVKTTDAKVKVESTVDKTFEKSDSQSTVSSRMERKKIRTEENREAYSNSGESDSDDIIEDTPPSERSVLGSQLNTSLIFSTNEIKSEQTVENGLELENYYTRHWPLPPGLSKQEKRRRRKQKQKKKKLAAMRGAIYYDSDVEIVVKEEPKVEIDLTSRIEYDENEFEYDMNRQRKKARKESDQPPDDQKITVFKTEKVDDHLYGGFKTRDVYRQEKRVQRLKYTRRNSFNFSEETQEDAEFIAALETASAEKGGVRSKSESTNDLSKGEPLEDEYAKFMDEVSGIEAECDENSDETKRSKIDSAVEDELNNAGKVENEQMENKQANDQTEKEIENSDKTTEEKEKEIDIQTGSSEKTKTSKSKIQYTETKEGKKLMRISLSGSKKPGLMPKQNDLNNEIFIDLSGEDHDADDAAEKAITSTTEISAADNESKSDTNVDAKLSKTVSKSDKTKDKTLTTAIVVTEKESTFKRAIAASELKIESLDVPGKKKSSDIKETETVDKLDNGHKDQNEYWDDGSCIVYVDDEENSDGSSSSGEWLSCSKAVKNKQKSLQSSKKGKQKKKASKVPDTLTNSKRLNLEKEPVENVIDKYVKHLSSADNSNQSHERHTELDPHEVKKREKVKQKAFEAMFDVEFENESQDKSGHDESIPGLGSLDDLYEETISLSSDSEIEDNNKSYNSKKSLMSKDNRTEGSKSVGLEKTNKNLASREKDSVSDTLDRIAMNQISSSSKTSEVASHKDFGNRYKDSDKNRNTVRVVVDDKVGTRAKSEGDVLGPMDKGGDEDENEDMNTSLSSTTKNIPALQSSDKRRKKRIRKSRLSSFFATKSGPRVTTPSQIQTSVIGTTLSNLPFTPTYPAQNVTFRPPPQPFNALPPSVFNTPPPGFSAAPVSFTPTSKLGTAPKMTVPPPILTLPVRAPTIPPMPYGRFPSPLGTNPSSVSSPVVAPFQSPGTVPFTRFPPPSLTKSSSVANPVDMPSNFTASMPFVSSPVLTNYAGSVLNPGAAQSKFNASTTTLRNSSSVSGNFNFQSNIAQGAQQSSPSSLPDSTKSRFSYGSEQSPKSESDSSSFLASLPGAASQSLLSSRSLPSTVIGTLNKVLDVIMNTKVVSETDTATTTTQSGVGLTSTSEIQSNIDKSESLSQDQLDFEARDSKRNRFDRIGGYRQEEERYRRDYERRFSGDDHRYDADIRRESDIDIDRLRRLDSDKAFAVDDPRYDADVKHRSEVDRLRRPPTSDKHRYDPDRRRQSDDRDFDRLRRLDSDRSRSPYRDRHIPPLDDRPLSPFSEYERERARMLDRERARQEFYERRSREYDRYPEDEYYQRRRESDPYYDYSPPRYRERWHDPYYDDPWRSAREYDDRPRSPLDYESRRSQHYEASGRPPRDPSYPNRRDDPYHYPPRDRYDEADEETSADYRREKIRNIAPSRQPDRPKDKIPSLLDVKLGSGQTVTDQSAAKHQQNPLLTKQATAQKLDRFLNAKNKPPKPPVPIVVTRGKRVATATQGMIEKAQASMYTPVNTSGTQAVHTDDSDKPTFCTGLNPNSLGRTGYAYRQQQSKLNYGRKY